MFEGRPEGHKYQKGVFHHMKIVCYNQELIKGVNTVLKAVPQRTTMPILECILIEAENGEISLTANNMELGISTVISGDIVTPGSIAIDAKMFSEMVKKLPDNDVTIEANDSNYEVTIQCEEAFFRIRGKDGDEFTKLPSIDRDQYFTINQFDLKQVINQTIFSIATNENNKIMCGELFEVSGNNLRVTSLDGYRISIRNVELRDDYGKFKKIVPGKTLSEISKILTGEADSEVLVYVTNNHILFEFDDTVVVSRLIEGEYFHVEQMLTGDYATKVVINKRKLMSCFDRATLFIRESDKKPIIIDISDEGIDLKLVSNMGSFEEHATAEKTGKDLTIGFNPRFFMDILKVIDEEDINIYMMNSKAPCFIKDAEATYTYLLIPVSFSVPE